MVETDIAEVKQIVSSCTIVSKINWWSEFYIGLSMTNRLAKFNKTRKYDHQVDRACKPDIDSVVCRRRFEWYVEHTVVRNHRLSQPGFRSSESIAKRRLGQPEFIGDIAK